MNFLEAWYGRMDKVRAVEGVRLSFIATKGPRYDICGLGFFHPTMWTYHDNDNRRRRP